MKLIDVSTPKYPNTLTMVDDADFDWLNQWKWGIGAGGYVRRMQRLNGKQIPVYMHIEILKPPPGMHGDHRFGDKLDHRRENLRICTTAENNRNKKPMRGRVLPKGVSWSSRQRQFVAQIQFNYHGHHLGYFPTASEAESAYIAASKKYHGEFAYQDPLRIQNAQASASIPQDWRAVQAGGP